jgi:hypothetical protein
MTIRRFSFPHVGMLAALMAAALAMACGGVDSGGTGLSADTAATGRISGFGSVIVNSVRYDDSTAIVVDDDGKPRPATDLKLGMVVEIDAGPLKTDGTGTRSAARRIQFGSEMAGPVQSVDANAGSLVVLGQSVRVDADTVFDGIDNGLSGIAVGSAVEVFGFYEPQSGLYAATRIQVSAGLTRYHVRGSVSNLNLPARTFDIGGAPIRYGGLPPADAALLTNGALVRVELQTSPQAGRWVASGLRSLLRGIPEGAEVELEGYVTDFISPSSFKVQGSLVDAGGNGVNFQNGLRSQLANGVRVEVQGRMQAGVLVATKLQIRKAGGGDQQFELHGRIDGLNTANQTFLLRGVLVSYDMATKYERGSAADLVQGAEVEVRARPAPGGVRLVATTIRFEK